jgi:hypothetical protein
MSVFLISMHTFYAIVVFIIVVILYSQLVFQLKKGDDLEIFETDYTTNADLNKSTLLKQPFIFAFSDFDSSLKHIDIVNDYGSFDVIIKDKNDYYADKPGNKSISMSLNAANALVATDPDAKFYSDSNSHFIEDTGLKKYYQNLDKYLEPHFNVFSKYDVGFGGGTPLLYHTYERRYLYVVSGSMRVKMCPWRSSKYIVINKNYESYEFSSPLNVWTPQDVYANSYNKIKFLEFTVPSGSVLYVPPFWFYSCKYEDSNTYVHSFNYGSPMNLLANAGNLFNYYWLIFGPDYKEESAENVASVITL